MSTEAEALALIARTFPGGQRNPRYVGAPSANEVAEAKAAMVELQARAVVTPLFVTRIDGTVISAGVAYIWGAAR